MNVLSSLPEEKILEICQQMDDPTLLRFLSVSKENQRICSEVLIKRRKEYLDIFKQNQVEWEKQLPDGTISTITFFRSNLGKRNFIQQYDMKLMSLPEVESIFPPDIQIFETGDEEAGYIIVYRKADNLSENDLLRILKRIERFGYPRVV